MEKEQFIDDIKEIYKHIGNEVSKEIFVNRLMYSITKDIKFVKKVVETTEEGKLFLDRLYQNKKKFIFGAGIWGKEILNTYTDISFEGFVDNDKKKCGTQYAGLPIISFDEYQENYSEEALIIISSRIYYREIYNQLINAGIHESLIINAGKFTDKLSDEQYFNLIELNDYRKSKECFIDAGSFDGNTSINFVKWCNKSFKTSGIEIYAFEPDEKNAEKCVKKLAECKDINKFKVIKKGLWDKKEQLRFHAMSNGGSIICEDGEYYIYVDSLDNLIDKEEVTFIKMDLEGSEYEAIEGAKRIIKDNKPKLAISVYHKPEDIWKISKQILDIRSDYVLYLGHYSVAGYETVLYAL